MVGLGGWSVTDGTAAATRLVSPTFRPRNVLAYLTVFAFFVSGSLAPRVDVESDPKVRGEAMLAVESPAADTDPPPLTAEQLAVAISHGEADWTAVLPDPDFSDITFAITDLPGLQLAMTTASTIEVDATAAGHGWDAVDLLTVVRHELGHVLGFEHTADGVMSETLAPGETIEVTDLTIPAAPVSTTTSEPATVTTSATGSTEVDPQTAASDTATVSATAPADDPAPTSGTPSTSTSGTPSGTGSTLDEPSASGAPSPSGTTATTGTAPAAGTDAQPEAAASWTSPTTTTTTTTSTSTTTTTSTSSSGEPTAATDDPPTTVVGTASATTDPGTAGAGETSESGTRWVVTDGVATLDTSDGRALDATIRYDAATNSIQVVAADGAVDSLPLDGVTAVEVAGGAADDTITVDASLADAPVTVAVDGGSGSNLLVGPTSDTAWTISGPDRGSLLGVAFNGFGSLRGSAGNEDTFLLEVAGSLTGAIDGGDAGFDSLVVDGPHGSLQSNPIDAHSGTLTIDGVLLRYIGLEPITISGTSSITITGDGADNTIDVHSTGPVTQIEVASPTAESHLFTAVGVDTLTIIGGGGVDTVTFTGAVDLVAADLIVHAEWITVAAGASVTTTGDITLEASAVRLGGIGPLPSAQALVHGSITAGGTVRITATATDDWTLASQVLVSDLTFTVGGTAIAEIRGTTGPASVTAGALVLTADTVVVFGWDGDAPGASST
ncbi:MAG: hypothetical protein ABIP17_07290, partial [Ilumatobacteraceae bacterium]